MKTKKIRRQISDIIDSSLTPSAAAKGLFPKFTDLHKKKLK